MADEKSLSTGNGPQLDSDKTIDEKPVARGSSSESSSATKTETPVVDGGGNVDRHQSNHPHFGAGREDVPEIEKVGTNDKVEMTEEMCYDELGFAFPEWKKW